MYPPRICRTCRQEYQRVDMNDQCQRCNKPRYCKACQAPFWSSNAQRVRCIPCAKAYRAHIMQYGKADRGTLRTGESPISACQLGTFYYTQDENKVRRERLHKRLFGGKKE